jgi:5-methylcytosine-specific restriction endonuclease McrA
MPERRVTTRQRQQVSERSQGCCEYCRSQARFATQSFSVEHIIPRRQGGKTSLDNLALSCQGCNGHKYTKIEGEDPISGARTPIYHPRNQRWQDHFRWSEDFTLVVGITPIGRATVEVLQLNRSGLINLRQVLYELGQHPPAD